IMTSLVFTANVSNITGGATWWHLKELLKTAGWTVKSSGDGISAFSSSTDILSQASTGANGMDNSNAWFRIQQPSLSTPYGPAQAINREFTFQRTASSSGVIIKYSYSAKFTGGSPSATVTPTATDQQQVANQNVWASDTFFHINLGAQTSDGYGFWMAPILNGNTNTNNSGGMVFDSMVPGTYPTDDTDPYVIWVETQSSGSFNASKLSSQGPGFAWFGKGTTLETFGFVACTTWESSGGNALYPNGAGVDPWSLKDQIAPILWCKNFTNTGLAAIKGVGTLMMWNGTQKQSGQLMSLNSAGDRIAITDVNFPWNNTAILV
ncbi:MAG TPA: hypothetical protein VM577_15555, partial [Anaerovoracaceae bacterium]|nr:hypothetical protein [Anaerovoracaceae bacterium]